MVITPLAQHHQRNKQRKIIIWQHTILIGGEKEKCDKETQLTLMDCELDRDQYFSSAGGEEKLFSKMLACKVTGLVKNPSMKNRRRSK